MADQVYAQAAEFEERPVYYPQVRPGYAGWVSLFEFGNGELGLAFTEIKREENPDWQPTPLEFAEAMVLPYMFGPVEANASPKFVNEYVYMKSDDGGRTWTETGRCPVATRHYWHVGFPDGRMVRIYGTSFMAHLGEDRNQVMVEHSTDGGNTWQELCRFLQGYSINMLKVHRVSDNSIVACGSIKPSFGPGAVRDTRTAVGELYPDEAAFFVSHDDGHSWEGPHYVLSGIAASEFDFVELPGGDLLFINSTIHTGRPVRQIVKKTVTGYVNEPVQAIHRGAPTQPEDWKHCRGFVPETICMTSDGLLVGALRNRTYSCSNDLGANWYEIAGLPDSKYQPMIACLSDGRFLNAWHLGSDHHFAEVDMFVGLHSFRVEADLPDPTSLSLRRQLDSEGNRYINAFEVRLTCSGKPVAGRKIRLHMLPRYRPDGYEHTGEVRDATDVREAVTDDQGTVRFALPEMDQCRDIHFSYKVVAIFSPEAGDDLLPCQSPERRAYAMTPTRNCPSTYPVYMCQRWLSITPETAERFPELLTVGEKLDKRNPDASFDKWVEMVGSQARAREIVDFLVENHILTLGEDGIYRWCRTAGANGEVVHGIQVSDLEEYYV